jgi:iron(III) transport system substrate-binding protein
LRLKLFLIACAALAATGACAQTRLLVYSAGPPGLINLLAKGFSANTGAKVDVFQGATGEVMARVEAEAGNPKADVVISASWDTADDFAARGWLLPYAPDRPDTIPDFLRSADAVAEGVSGLGIAWSPDSGTPRPQDWADLAGSAFKGKVTIPDPSQSGASFELTAALEARDGGPALFHRLKDNGAVVAPANAQALTSVLQGAKAAVFGAVDYISYAEKGNGESVEMIFPKAGTIVAARPMMMMKWSKQPGLAKQFLDYVLSADGQKIVAKAHLMPARSDVAADRPLVKDLTLLHLDAGKAYAQRKAMLAEFAKIFAE